MAAEGKGLTSELVEALTKANQSLVRLEENMNDAPPQELKAWRDRIEQARQILDGYIAEIYLEGWLMDGALNADNPAAAPQRHWGRSDAQIWSLKLRVEFNVPIPRMLVRAPWTPGDPKMSLELCLDAEAANRASHDVANAGAGDRSGEIYVAAVARLSRALRNVHTTLDPLDPNPTKLSVPDTWKARMEKWHDQLDKGVKELKDQAAILGGLIKLNQHVVEDEGTRTIIRPPAEVPELEARLGYIQEVLRQVELNSAMSSTATDFN
jgi:hypothetical protein